MQNLRLLTTLALPLLILACAAPEALPSPEPSAEASPAPTHTASTPAITPTPIPVPIETASAPAPPPSPSPAAPAPTTRAEPTPDADGWIGPDRISTRNYGELSLAIDDEGIAHAAAELGDGIFYLTNASGSWTRERLSRAPSGGDDQYPSIAIDDDGSLWIAFTRWAIWEPCIDVCVRPERFQNDGIYYLTYAGVGWPQPRLALADAVMGSMVVRDGHVHLAYYEASREDAIRYATGSSGEWQSRQVAASASSYAMQFAPDGVAVFIVASDNEGLAYVTGNIDSGFADEQTVPCLGDQFELALDDLGTPHVVTADRTIVLCVKGGDGGWSGPHEVSGDELAPGRDGSLWSTPTGASVDGFGALHVIYLVISGLGDDEYFLWEDLWYASNTGGSFESHHLSRGLGSDFGPPGSSALALDRRGRPHVLFTAASVDSDEELVGLWYAIGPGH